MNQYIGAYFSDGPTPKFSPYHVWKTFHLIGVQGPISRKKLAETLGLGEGSIRTILNKMIQEEMIINNREGAVLTERGKRRLEAMGIEVSPIEVDLGISGVQCAALARGMSKHVRNGREQRDASCRSGAEGAVTLVIKNGKPIFPGDNYPLEAENVKALQNKFESSDNDVLIIGFSHLYKDAEKGAVTAALTLSDSSGGCWNDGPRVLTMDTEANELECLALAMHELAGRMPLSMRSKNKLGVLCEDGLIVDRHYTGPNLEETLSTGKVVRRVASSGPFTGAPVVVVPITMGKEFVAAIGLVDFTQLSIYDIMGRIRKTNVGNLPLGIR
jgi:predicted transcriptional regulator